jgi:RNA polymerase sigma-32 factor
MLQPQEEYMLAKRYKEHEDRDAAHKLVTSHLRLVAKIAMGYRGYGLPIGEVISEGNVGLMQAVKRFEPERGFRLATYAMWWIRAAIQEYILRSWSLVKIGRGTNERRLFYNLRKVKSQIVAIEEGDLRPEHAREIARRLGVTEAEVVSMNRRLARDLSLNAPMGVDGETSEWQDWLVDEAASQEELLTEREEADNRHRLLIDAMQVLNDREPAFSRPDALPKSQRPLKYCRTSSPSVESASDKSRSVHSKRCKRHSKKASACLGRRRRRHASPPRGWIGCPARRGLRGAISSQRFDSFRRAEKHQSRRSALDRRHAADLAHRHCHVRLCDCAHSAGAM